MPIPVPETAPPPFLKFLYDALTPFRGFAPNRPPGPASPQGPLHSVFQDAEASRQAYNSLFSRAVTKLPSPHLEADIRDVNQGNRDEREWMFAKALEAYMAAKRAKLNLPPFEQMWKKIDPAGVGFDWQRLPERIAPMEFKEFPEPKRLLPMPNPNQLAP